MTKPDDIPLDIWDTATNLSLLWQGEDHPYRPNFSEDIARAIMAERNACSALLMFASEDKQSLRLALGEMTAQEMRTLIAGIHYLAAAIRNRGEG